MKKSGTTELNLFSTGWDKSAVRDQEACRKQTFVIVNPVSIRFAQHFILSSAHPVFSNWSVDHRLSDIQSTIIEKLNPSEGLFFSV